MSHNQNNVKVPVTPQNTGTENIGSNQPENPGSRHQSSAGVSQEIPEHWSASWYDNRNVNLTHLDMPKDKNNFEISWTQTAT